MIISKISDLENRNLMAEKYLEWLDLGVLPSEILVLTFNSNSKQNFLKFLLKFTDKNTISDAKIYTYNGLIYNTVSDNWCMLENKLSNKNSQILPNLSGLEIAQYFFKQIIKENEVKGYNSKKSLLHQLFRRYSLIVNNNLSDEEVLKKSKILKESFSNDASDVINAYRLKTLETRTLDNLRQAQIFSYIFNKTDYFKDIKYLLADDADELSPLFYDFFKSISPQLVDKLVLFDEFGGSRSGYLCAVQNSAELLKECFSDEIQPAAEESGNIISLRENVLNGEKNPLNNITKLSLSKRVDMIDDVLEKINNLIKSGIPPSDISVITPVQDKLLRFSLNNSLKNCTPLFLSGSEKLADNSLVKALITILKMSVNKQVDEYELRVVLFKYLGIQIKDTKYILSDYKKTGVLRVSSEVDEYENYKSFCTLLDKITHSSLTLSEKAYYIYQNVITTVDKTDLTKFNFFLKQLQDFGKVLKNDEFHNYDEEIITQIENSIISENPYSVLDIQKENIVIATPQKVIDNKIRTKYQFWLDTTSEEWVKSDIGPLYNSWVFQKQWNKSVYTIEDNLKFSKEKTFKILRKLILNTEKVFVYSSLFDSQGIENFGGIDEYLVSSESVSIDESDDKVFKITPRDDQKPVLEYTSGNMAISAVPGAGKTTILLALIIELMKKDINPENVYVLTYMESASRTFKDRIKSVTGSNSKLPNISTIHGLALRILKENSNFERLGLNSDFEICDDVQRTNILREISGNISKQDVDEFDRAISVLKLSGVNINPDTNKRIYDLLTLKKGTYDEMKLSRFLKFFFEYRKKLMANNLIDYDDILISSVKLLEQNPDILDYYQNICQYVIEDEAQDSSFIQQKLINLLTAKNNNLIRCGDVNQAITTTFTNADVEGFKRFIESSQRVDMNCSQRCSEGVWTLANKLVKYGNSQGFKPFFEIYMSPVEGKNPVVDKSVYSKIYDTSGEEKIETVKTIKSILSKEPDATVGILLRNNYQVNTWSDYINNSGLTAITRNECLGQKKIFRAIYSVLKVVSEPFDNSVLAFAYKTLVECGVYKSRKENFIEDFEGEFISVENDKIQDVELARFHWDMNYWLSFPELTIDELALMIGFNYFSKSLEKSNIHLISTLCAKLNRGSFSQTLKSLEELSKRNTLSGFKFFSEDEDEACGKIQIMTLHKSKGDEFDYVFLPEMTEKNLSLDIKSLRLKKSSDFMENVRALNRDYVSKSEKELKEFIISENYRLLYVAITRAKKKLYLSASEKEVAFGKQRSCTPSIIFGELL